MSETIDFKDIAEQAKKLEAEGIFNTGISSMNEERSINCDTETDTLLYQTAEIMLKQFLFYETVKSVSDMLEKSRINPENFKIDKESFKRFLYDEDIVPGVPGTLTFSWNDTLHKKMYKVAAIIVIDGCDEALTTAETSITAVLTKENPDGTGFEIYKDGGWHTASLADITGMPRHFCDILEQEDEEAEFAKELYPECNPENEKEFHELLKKATPLFRILKSTKDFMRAHWITDDEEGLLPILEPDDERRHGICVSYESDGKYAINAFLTKEGFNGDENKEEILMICVYKTDNPQEIIRYLKSKVNRYLKKEKWEVPLSEKRSYSADDIYDRNVFKKAKRQAENSYTPEEIDALDAIAEFYGFSD